MAENEIQARILLRYDTLDNWLESSLILLEGEVAIAAAQSSYSIGDTNSRPLNTPPAIGMKVGDGYHRFPELPWVQAVAADVYNWAKQSTKPSYNANEIQGLTTLIQQYINQHGGGGSGEVTIEARQYRIIEGTGNDSNKYFLQSLGENDTDWVTDTLNYIDLTQYADVLSWLGTAPADYWNINGYVNDKIDTKINALDYTDNYEVGKVVLGVDQNNGKISVTHGNLYADQISGIISVEKGGTGRQSLPYDEVLIGNGVDSVITKPIDLTLTDNTNLATNHAIISYINNATAGLTGAMHYIGEATVDITNGSSINPRINDYNFSNAQPGDVITYNYSEYVWTGGMWRLLGDEGSYIIKGMVTDRDIMDNANIAQSKIAGLIASLDAKVDKVEGKSLTSNDFTDEYKQKLDDIEDNAQRNLIEHIYINGTEAIPSVIEGKANSLSIRLSSLTPEEEEKLRGIETNAQVNIIEHFFLNETELLPKTYKNLAKSIQLQLTLFTDEEKQKLSGIATGAQVNTIEKISVDGVLQTPDQDKIVDIQMPVLTPYENKIEKIYLNNIEQIPTNDKYVYLSIDESAVSFTVLKGARVPTGIVATPYEDVEMDQTTKKLELARIAKTGEIYDIVNTPQSNTTDYLILRCGDSTTLID